MTIPLWVPFALLAGWCWIWPPDWMRRALGGVDMLKVVVYGYCVAFWVFVALFLAGVL